MKDFINNPRHIDEDSIVEETLRPKKLDDFIGQESLKLNLSYAIKSAKERSKSIDHIILYGPPGLGKTTLAEIIANEMGVNFISTSGPALTKPGDIVGILTRLKSRDVFFIDEIHRLSKTIEEYLYPAMEDFKVDLILDTGPNARTMKIKIEEFTLIGATTIAGKISQPLRDRFGIVLKVDYYNEEELKRIILRSAKILEIGITEKAALSLARRSRGTPRIANRLLKRTRDVAIVDKKDFIDEEVVNKTLKIINIDKYGLDETDRKILEVIIKNFSGGPVGVKNIAIGIGEDPQTIEEVYEPFLIQKGFIKRTPRGRVATKKAYDVLGIKNYDDSEDLSLF